MRHLLRPLRNQALIPVIALKALPVKRSSETPFLATCPCSWRYCYEGFGDCAIRFLHGVSKMEMRSHGFVMANQIDLKSLDEQLERHLNRAWTMEIGEEQEEADAGLFTISVFLSLFFGATATMKESSRGLNDALKLNASRVAALLVVYNQRKSSYLSCHAITIKVGGISHSSQKLYVSASSSAYAPDPKPCEQSSRSTDQEVESHLVSVCSLRAAASTRENVQNSVDAHNRVVPEVSPAADITPRASSTRELVIFIPV
nr:serine/threonine-protein kinase STY8-like [Ipomoea batatas]